MKQGEHILLNAREFKDTAVDLGYAGSVGARAFDTLARYFADEGGVRTSESVVFAEQSRGNHKPVERAISIPNLALRIDELNPDSPDLKIGDITIEIAHDIVSHYKLPTHDQLVVTPETQK